MLSIRSIISVPPFVRLTFSPMPVFLHTSDLHLNALRRFSSFYLDRMRGCLDAITTIARQRAVDFIVVAGDLYDRRDITHAERMLLSEWLSSVEIPVVLISGNHDKRSTEVGDTCISYLSALSSHFGSHIIYDGIPCVLEKFGCYLMLLPYQGWMDQELFLVIGALLQQCTNVTLPVIVIMHEAVRGCKTDVGLSVTKSNQIRLDASFPRVRYWALGDMHLCQKLLPNAWYCGAPHQTRFDETLEKGVLIVNTDQEGDPEFVSVPSTQLLVLTDPPAHWPTPTEALIQFRPSSLQVESTLPKNVEFHPSVGSLRGPDGKDQPPEMVGLFDGLDDALQRASLREDLWPLAWRLAVKFGKELGLEIPLPERYSVPDVE